MYIKIWILAFIWLYVTVCLWEHVLFSPQFPIQKKKNSDNSYLYHLIVMKKILCGKKFWKLYLHIICRKIINLYQFYTKIVHVVPFISNWYTISFCFCIICGVVWYLWFYELQMFLSISEDESERHTVMSDSLWPRGQ